ncbi:MAG TPA: SUMF1/EgtB/PvdO family nonheme iron enzyme [Candidatus Acidoferrales bacterium]|nr:SUMF1/EgtB/PvdO family nonheme iron enzyme [Candidatus Acidoferrales bacterium]
MRHAANMLSLLACLLLMGPAPLAGQLRPETSQPPEKKAETTPARIVVETLPGAEVYLDDERQGQASAGGRLVISNPKPGEHTLRVTLAGKKDYEQKVTVTAGKDATVKAALAEPEQPPPAAVPAPRVETPRPAAAPAAGTVRENRKDGLKYVWIPPGTFSMGCSPGDSECFPAEEPAHAVTISKGFWIGQTVVTVGAYKRFTAGTGQQMPPAPSFNSGWTDENMPIVNVSWNDSQAYCQWTGGRLPTEAEREYAARGGSTEARYGPLDEVAWYSGNSGGGTHDVAQKRANGFGLYDTLGIVLEWVNDWYDANYYQNSPSQDPAGPSSGQYRVLRGGSWFIGPRVVRVSYRNGYDPAYRYVDLGLRCVGEANIP